MNTLCDVPGIRVGHAQDFDARTGCTVILPHDGAVCGVDIRGSSPGTREIELLKPVRNVQEIHAVLLTGGSAFGLNAAGGVQAFLEEQGIGYDVGCCKVPLVPAAVIFDLFVGSHRIRPDETMGYQACENASEKEAREGNVVPQSEKSGDEKIAPGEGSGCVPKPSAEELSWEFLLSSIASVM